jgi:hypothetical protein
MPHHYMMSAAGAFDEAGLSSAEERPAVGAAGDHESVGIDLTLARPDSIPAGVAPNGLDVGLGREGCGDRRFGATGFRAAPAGGAVLGEAPIRATDQVAVSEARCEVPATDV